jgi:hypothetical protein
MKMKVLGTAATFIGAITLMFAIVVAQLNYQHNWTAGANLQSNTVISEVAPIAPERLAQAGN